MARFIAKELVDGDDLDFCEVQFGYAIGVPEPVGISVRSSDPGWDTGRADYIAKEYDLTPSGIIGFLDLTKWDYRLLAQGCHYRPLGDILY